jgi:ribonucleoside-diphosphate reductase alpha chain
VTIIQQDTQNTDKNTTTQKSKSGNRPLFERRYTQLGVNPLNTVKTEKRKSVIYNTDGSVVFSLDKVDVPQSWSQLATDIAVSKYFRKSGVPGKGHEHSVKQLVYRVAHTIRFYGEQQDYFVSKAEADTFEAELAFLLINQYGAFNSPVWFNCGLYHEYGIKGNSGNWAWDMEKDEAVKVDHAYQRPQCSACFIQKVDDSLDSIFDLVKNEARLFKYGSGTGTNFSRVRGKQEKLSGGGTSSGLVSFLEVLDRGAGATKSGGTTRRAAKMVCLDMDHPEILDFIKWKVQEEEKAKLLIEYGNMPADFNGEAYKTVSGQNSNNSVRVTDEFMQAVEGDKPWQTKFRTNGKVHETMQARDLFDEVANAAWRCADPGIQYDSTINNWHTCADTDRIYASNPCSEYMFLDDSACNLASLNLMKYYNPDTRVFDIEGYRHATAVFTTAQEIIVDLASYPTETITKNSHDYRPLGLGYANLGTLLMVEGVPYDSAEALSVTGALTAILTGQSYLTSAHLAARKGPFAGYAKNEKSMLKVMRQHRDATGDIHQVDATKALIKEAKQVWDDVVKAGEKYGFRNAQSTVIAPTGTIGLLMDCDTTGIEPDFSIVKFKKLAGGGYFKIVNSSVPLALKNLGYSKKERDEIIAYSIGHNTFKNAPHINFESLAEKGITNTVIEKMEKALLSAMSLEQVFNSQYLGEELMHELKLDESLPISLLEQLGFTGDQIQEAHEWINGTMSMEGGPYLKDEHLPIFDCANTCGEKGTRFLEPMAHVRIMAAAQPFISGAISKTINMPNQSSVEDIKNLYVKAWELGLKAVAIYRDGCKSSQPLSSRSDKKQQPKEKAAESKMQTESVSPVVQPRRSPTGTRIRLPRKRKGFTQEARIAGHKIYLRTGDYEDGSLGEIFVDMHKEGASFRSLMNCFAIAVSLGLQHGVPLDEYVNSFVFTRFEPQGMVDHPNVKSATSVIDYIFRVLGMEYLGRTDFVHVKPELTDPDVGEVGPEKSISTQAVQTEPKKKAPLGLQGAPQAQDSTPVSVESKTTLAANIKKPDDSLNKQLASFGDAPFCDICGHTTIRNGACFKCLNCGASLGCS